MTTSRFRLGMPLFSIVFIAGIALISASGGEAGSEQKPAPEPSVAVSGVPSEKTAATQAKVQVQTEKSKACLADPVVIEDLKKRNEELEARAKQLEAREAEFKAKEVALDEELKRLEKVRSEIDAANGVVRKENEEKVAKLVAMLETMSPKAASQMVATIDDALAVAAMSRMTTPKLAKIMNVMEPGRSSKLAELLAGTVRVERMKVRTSTSNGVAAGGEKSVKGGDNDDGHVE
jgi:flagellar motility protein MotE (MotC chaperone)